MFDHCCTVVNNIDLLKKRSPMALGDEWPDLLTVREVAKILRVSPLTIKRWGKRGKLPESASIPAATEIQKRSRPLASRSAAKRGGVKATRAKPVT